MCYGKRQVLAEVVIKTRYISTLPTDLAIFGLNPNLNLLKENILLKSLGSLILTAISVITDFDWDGIN